MNSAPDSSTQSGPHTTRSSDANGIFAVASSPSGASAANTSDTDFRPRSRTAAISSGLVHGMHGTYQSAAGSAASAPPATQATTSATRPLHDPQPLPARVFATTSPTLDAPACTHATISPLVTPLQLHTCAPSASSAAPVAAAGVPRSKSIEMRSSGRGTFSSNACDRNPTLLTSPSRVAPISLLSRTTTDL